MDVLEQTVTIRVADLYDYLLRRLEEPMPDDTNIPAVRRAKRGYRRITVILRVQDYADLEAIADQEQREPGQQAAYMLRTMLEHARKVVGGDKEDDGGGVYSGADAP